METLMTKPTALRPVILDAIKAHTSWIEEDQAVLDLARAIRRTEGDPVEILSGHLAAWIEKRLKLSGKRQPNDPNETIQGQEYELLHAAAGSPGDPETAWREQGRKMFGPFFPRLEKFTFKAHLPILAKWKTNPPKGEPRHAAVRELYDLGRLPEARGEFDPETAYGSLMRRMTEQRARTADIFSKTVDLLEGLWEAESHEE